MIKAECHSDDRASEVEFDATPWFEQAGDVAIIDLAKCDWGGDCPADEVAIYMADKNREIADMFTYIEARHKIEPMGFECHVDGDSALEWVKKYRSYVYAKIEK